MLMSAGPGHLSRGPRLGMYLTPQPSGMSCFSATMFSNSSALNLVNPHFLEMWIFWRPGNLSLARWKASITCSLFCSWWGWTLWPGQCGPWPLCPGAFKGTAHTCLESISSSARHHLVDADDMEGVEMYSDVKTIFATAFHHVLVGINTGSLQGFRGELLILIWHHVATEWELIHFGLLTPQVKDANLSIRDTSAEAQLWVWLVLTIPVTPGRVAAHGNTWIFNGVPKGKSWILISYEIRDFKFFSHSMDCLFPLSTVSLTHKNFKFSCRKKRNLLNFILALNMLKWNDLNMLKLNLHVSIIYKIKLTWRK